MSQLLCFCYLIHLSISVTVFDIPFSWDRIPVWSFPGFSNHFLTDTEVYNPSNSLNNFSYVLLSAFNASCLLPNGTYYPATTTNWWYECSSTPGDISNMTINLQIYPNLEPSIAYQAMQLKQKYLNSKNNSIILAYIETINSQMSYITQAQFNEEKYKSEWLYISNKGYINCMEYNHSMGCDYQGPSAHQYDHRQEKVRKYFINNVLNSILFDYVYSEYLDGVFLDTMSSWIEPYALCYDWNCTQEEYNQLYNASLQITDDSLKYLQSVSKIGSVSIRGDLFDASKYYKQHLELIIKYKDIAVKYHEEICNTRVSTLYNKMITLLYELQYNISIQVHVLPATYNPDMVELAGYLIIAQNNTWFSQSIGGWGVNDSWWIPEFNNKLGKPLENGKCNYTYYGFNDLSKWKIVINQTVIGCCTNRMIAGGNESIYGAIYMGIYNNFIDCRNKIEKYAKIYNFTSFTYYGNVIDKQGNWTNMCYGRIGVIINNNNFNSNNNIGWFGYKQINATSANIFDYTCERNFQYLNVKVNPISMEAYLNWK
eukprot:383708_1